MKNEMNDFIDAVDKIADTSFYVTDTFGDNVIAKRPWGSTKTGFYRPGERSENGAPFEVTPTKCAQYMGLPSGRTPTNDEKRGAWQLQEEYLAGRLGKDEEENGRLWNTVKWIDRHYRIAAMPAHATKALNLYVDNWEDVKHPEGTIQDEGNEGFSNEENEGFEYEQNFIDKTQKDSLGLKVFEYDLLALVDGLEEIDELAKIDVNKLTREADPLPERVDFPSPIDRAESGKIIRVLKLGMRTLWHPVIRAIADHSTMKSLGKTQGVGDGVAAAVGRCRVIEGLRVAESIRKGIARSTERLAVDEAKHCPPSDATWRSWTSLSMRF
jgi:hypothetical protein